jgi:hypothetical protein
MFGKASLGIHGSIPVTRIKIGSSTELNVSWPNTITRSPKHALASARIFGLLNRQVIVFPVASLATRKRMPRLTLIDSRVPTTEVSVS